jgi:Cysteine-rich secretory protein family
MSGKRRWLSLLLVAVLAIIGLGVAAGADSGTEAEFLAKINASRANAGLAPLAAKGSLTSYARSHTAGMMDAGKIYHSSSAQLGAAGGTGWDRMGENVGRGQSPSSLHEAFMNSSGHRANILGDYNYVGIGTGTKDGYLYVTVIFMKKGSSSAPATTTTTAADSPDTTKASSSGTAKPKPTTTTEATTTTTTTLPPTTTTTMIVGPDKAVIPGEACVEAGRFGQLCHD